VLAVAAVAPGHARAADRIYWSSPGDGTIRAADPSGGGMVDTLYSGHGARSGIDVDVAGERLIWSVPADKAIRFGPLDGSGPVESLTATSDFPRGVAVDPSGGRLLWLDSSSLKAVPLAGGATTTVLNCCTEESPVPENGSSVAVDDINGRVYFNSGVGGDGVYSAPLDGSAPGALLYGLGVDTYVNDLAVDPVRGFVYWASSNEGPDRRIQRAPIDGSGPVQLLYRPERVAAGIAVDAAEGNLYWTEPGDDAIRRAPLDGSGPVQTVVTTATWPAEIVLLRTPLNTSVPRVSGGTTVGSRLSCDKATWTNEDVHGSFVHRPAISGFTYRWQRDGTDEPGADQPTYTPSRAGAHRCVLTAINSAGASDATSAARIVMAPPPDPGPSQTLTLGNAFIGRSGSIFVPVTCVNRVAGYCDTTLKIVFRKPTHGFRTITRELRLTAGASLTRITLSRKQRRKLLRIRRLRIAVELTNPPGAPVTRGSTLSGGVSLHR